MRIPKLNLNVAETNARAIYEQQKRALKPLVSLQIEAEAIGSTQLCKITNKVLNKGKSPIPTLLNGPNVISSLKDKATMFGDLFAENRNLDDQASPIPELHSRTNNLISNIKVTVKYVRKYIDKLSVSKATGPVEIPVVVLKNTAPELAPFLTKLFNRCLNEKCFPSSWKLSSVCPVF